jgi:hypothetical protein
MSFSSSGGTGDVPALDGNALATFFVSPFDEIQASATSLVSGLSMGYHTFIVKYRTQEGTAVFSNRGISVIPMP